MGLRRWREGGGLDKGVFGGFLRGRRRKFICGVVLFWESAVEVIPPRRAERDIGKQVLADRLACCGAFGDLLEGAQGFVDGFGVGEGVEEVRGDEDDVGSALHAVVVFAAYGLAHLQRARCEVIDLLLHRFRSRWCWLFVPR